MVASWQVAPTEDDYTFEIQDPPPLSARTSSIWCCYYHTHPLTEQQRKMSSANWMERMKKAGKSVVDAGAKTMLRVRPFSACHFFFWACLLPCACCRVHFAQNE